MYLSTYFFGKTWKKLGVKFSFSEIVTKIWGNHYLVMSKPWGRLRQIFVAFSEKLNFIELHLHHFRYFSGSTNHVSFILFTFFLKRVSFSAVFQIQWLGRISLFWKSRVHFTTQWSTQRKVQFMGFQRVSKDVLLLVNVVD